jgi:hypothetical protein
MIVPENNNHHKSQRQACERRKRANDRRTGQKPEVTDRRHGCEPRSGAVADDMFVTLHASDRAPSNTKLSCASDKLNFC